MTEATSIEAPPRPRPEIETAFVGGEAVLLNVDTGAVYALNPSASVVWLLLDGVPTDAALADELSEIVHGPRRRAAARRRDGARRLRRARAARATAERRQ